MHPFIIIRLWPRFSERQEDLDELLSTLKQYPKLCDELWFCTADGFPSLETHQACADAIAQAAKEVRKLGILAGLQIGTMLGHGDRDHFPGEGINWKPMVDFDGTAAQQAPCPRDPAYLHYLQAMGEIYGRFEPSTCYLDDDLRLVHHPPIRWGCFCDQCLEAFRAEVPGAPTDNRAELVDALANDISLRQAWIAFNQKALATIAEAVSVGIRRDAPACRMGLQQCSHENDLLSGPDWQPIYAALAGPDACEVASRPGGGFYNDHAPRGMLEKALRIGRQVARLPESATLVTAEVETFPHLAANKTPQGLALESTLYLAMGCNALSYAILCSGFEDMEQYEPWLAKLAKWRPFWEQCSSLARNTHPGGLDLLLDREQALRVLSADEEPLAWARADLGQAFSLAEIGVPLAPDSRGACASLLHADAARGISAEGLKHAIEGGLILDTEALERLQERGLHTSLGLAVEDAPEAYTERLRSTSGAVRESSSWRETLRASPQRRILPEGAAVEALSQFEDTEGKPQGIASALIQPPQGGRVAVLGPYSFSAKLSVNKRLQCLDAADWVSDHRLPLRLDSDIPLAVFPRVDQQARFHHAIILNIQIDFVRQASLRLRHPISGKLQWIQPEGTAPVQAVRQGESELIVELPEMAPWSLGLLVCTEH